MSEAPSRKLEAARARLRALVSQAAEGPVSPADVAELKAVLDLLAAALDRSETASAGNDAEHALRRYRELFDLAPDGYLFTDTQGRVLEANGALATMLGRATQELVDRPLADFVAAAERLHLQELVRGIAGSTTHEARHRELSLHAASGAALLVEATVSPSFAADGTVAGLRWQLRDISARRQMEIALAESTATTRSLVAAAVDGIITIDESGIVESVNPAAERMFGYSSPDILGRNVDCLMPAPYRDEHSGYLARYLKTGERHVIGIGREVTGRRRDGSTFPMDLAVGEVLTPRGRLFVGYVRDLSEREAQAEALRREQELNRQVFDTAPALILVLDRHGRVVRFNAAMEHLTGHAAEEAEGRDWCEVFVPQAERARVRDVFADTLAGRDTRGTINAILLQEGETRTIEWHNTTLQNREGEVAGVLAVGTDITDRLALEEQFRQAQKMEAIGRLAGGVAHDFNTILGSVIGYSELLLERIGEGDPILRPVQQIHRAANRGAELTRQLLAFSRRQLLEPGVVDLVELVADMGEMIRRLVGEDIEVVQAMGDRPLRVVVDPNQLEQVLMNLTVNARDAMPRGGRLELRGEVVDEIGSRGAPSLSVGSYVVLHVSDTGSGMDAEVRQRIFDPFFSTKGTAGTGLGLSTVYGIVRQSGGGIEVESEPGVGTVFHIYLPQAGAVEAEAETAAAAAGDGPLPCGGDTVLVVEDDGVFLDLVTEVLEAHGLVVLRASTGAAAVALAACHPEPIRLVLTDVGLPDMRGPELVRRIAECHPEIRHLLMSGYSKETLAERSSTVENLLSKPFSPKELLSRVRRLLDRHGPDGES